MNEDRDTRDQDGGSAADQSTEAGSGTAGDVWARAAQQALRDMARAETHAAGRQKRTAKVVIP
jgi:hypothetical protein